MGTVARTTARRARTIARTMSTNAMRHSRGRARDDDDAEIDDGAARGDDGQRERRGAGEREDRLFASGGDSNAIGREYSKDYEGDEDGRRFSPQGGANEVREVARARESVRAFARGYPGD